MTQTRKHITDIILAAFVAVAMVFALATMTQNAYAAEDQPAFASKVSYEMGFHPLNHGWDMLPGESATLEANFWVDGAKEQPAVTYRWSLIKDGGNYATLQPGDAGSNQAALTMKEQPAGFEDKEVWVKVEAVNASGKVLAKTEDFIYLCDEYYVVMPRELDGVIAVGESMNVVTDMVFFSVEQPNGESVKDAQFAWVYETKKVKVDGSGNNFTITRLAAGSTELELQGRCIDASGEEVEMKSHLWLDDVSSHLEDYEMIIEGMTYLEDMPPYIYSDSTGSITPQVILKNDNYVLSADKYTLKYEQRKPESDDFIAVNPPLAAGENGAAEYRVQAVAKAGSGVTGKSYEEYFFVCRKNSVAWPAASVTFDSKYYVNPHKDYEDARYEVPLGVTLKPTVTVDGKTLTEGTDYIVEYIDHSHGHGLIQNFPDRTGVYACQITGKGTYMGINQDTLLYMGDKNPMTATAKASTLKASKLKKKAQTIKPITVKDAVGDVEFWAIDGDAKSMKALKIDEKTGKVTVKKGTKKGTYKNVVEIWAWGNETVGPTRTVVYVTVKVK